jgi:threonine dehydrogenase-like Zn-dependent dehydrogenase
MKALVWRGGNLLALESIPEPEPGPGEVVVQVVLAGICGSDLHAYRGHDTARTPPPATAVRRPNQPAFPLTAHLKEDLS